MPKIQKRVGHRGAFAVTVGIASATDYIPWLRRLMAAVNHSGARGTLSATAQWRCTVALIEAVNNAVIHAHRRDAQRRIWLTCVVHHRSVRLTVADEGRRFRWPRAAMPDPRRTGGRGIYLMRTLMHHVRYRRQGRRNLMELTYHDSQ